MNICRRRVTFWFLALIGIVATASGQQGQIPSSHNTGTTSLAKYRTVLDRYCGACHNEKTRTAGLVLTQLDLGNVGKGASVWEKVANKLRTGAMPPAGMPRPDQSTYDSLTAYLETALDSAAAVKPQSGRVAVHRLNRAEYTNAVRDLLGLDIDGASLLPVDDSGYGFDNIADVLSLSPTLLERYMSAARKVSRLAIGDPAIHPSVETYDLPWFLKQDDRMSEDLPFGSRGGTAIRYNFPLDAEYVIRVRLQTVSPLKPDVLGLSQEAQLEIRLDGARLKLLTIGGSHSDKKDPDTGLDVRFHSNAGTKTIGVDFMNADVESEGPLQSQTVAFREINRRDEQVLPYLGKVIIEGPYGAKGVGETLSRHKIFVCYPSHNVDELRCAQQILSSLARRAYRRPVTERDVTPLLSLYKQGKDRGGFEAGISTVIQGLLVSPAFLFRTEHEDSLPAGVAYPIGNLELASRLSFFLWSSIPDEQLLDLAASGKLKNPLVLEQQVRRMLADSRSDALVSNFAGQWLYLRNIRRVLPDPVIYPEFDDSLRSAFEQETELFLKSNLREDRPVLNLLNANYTFLNEQLARFYGIPNIYGSHFRRVALQDHPERRGLLGQGSILTVTSYANRTSPTLRGKWLLETVLGAPPPPPPPNVPSLKEQNSEDGKTLSVRQQMEEHRKNPACAVCHTRMDPLGFALENFNGIGEWRTSEGGVPVDASGVLPDGTQFDGPAELREVLQSSPKQFATAITEKLLTYALGRGLEYYDAPAVRKIIREAAAGNYRWSSLIVGITRSVPFQMKMNPGAQPGIAKTIASQTKTLAGQN
jgi:mono/diheme cytochrome c family protein